MSTAGTTGMTGQDRPPTLRDLVDPRHRGDPYPLYHDLREQSPFVTADREFVVLGRYEHCLGVLRDPSVSARPVAAVPGRKDRMLPSFMVQDSPDHTRLRKLVAKGFTPRAVAALETGIVRLTDELITGAAAKGYIDIVADLAKPLPITVICRWLGIPADDHELLHGWTERASRTLDPYAVTDRGAMLEALRAEFETEEYFRDLVARRRVEPGSDLVSELVAARDVNDSLSEGELLATLSLLLMAGHETATNLIGNGLLALLRQPAELTALRDRPGRAAQVVDEVLRYDPPVQMTTRRTTKPIRLGGVEIPPESRLAVLFAGANRDPAIFDQPDRFMVDRSHRPHLAFSGGPHFCLGAGLGRLEAAAVLTRFASRVVDPVLDETSVGYRQHVNLRGPRRAVVTFREVLASQA